MEAGKDITLRDHLETMAAERARLLEETARRLEQKIDYEGRLSEERDRRYTERFVAQENATLYMREITNEFRGQLRDQAANFITRSEALTRAQANADKIDVLATRLDRSEGKSGLTDPLIEGLVKDIKEIKAAQLEFAGQRQGRESSVKTFVTVIGLIVSFLVIAGVFVSVVISVR